MTLSLPSSTCLLPLCRAFEQYSSTCTSPSLAITNGCTVRLRAITIKRRRGLQVCKAATVEDVAEDVLLPRDAEEVKEAEEKYDWREEWYPLYLTKEVPEDAPLGLTVFHKQIVLYRDGKGVLTCYEDRCPHRLAKLSEGQLVDGRLECLYHGWQFEGDGKCVKIPQVEPNLPFLNWPAHLLLLLVSYSSVDEEEGAKKHKLGQGLRRSTHAPSHIFLKKSIG